jgi:hypothetical protein
MSITPDEGATEAVADAGTGTAEFVSVLLRVVMPAFAGAPLAFVVSEVPAAAFTFSIFAARADLLASTFATNTS